MNSAELPRLVLIIVPAVVFIFIIQSYNKSGNNNAKAPLMPVANNQVVPLEGFYADGEQTENAPNQNADLRGVPENLSDESDSDGEDPSAPRG